MIEESEAQRTDEWIKEAVEGGAELLTGGKGRGSVLHAYGADKYYAVDEGLRQRSIRTHCNA